MKKEQQLSEVCSLCGSSFEKRKIMHYPNIVCRKCDSRALNGEGNPARYSSDFPEYQEQLDKLRAEADPEDREFIILMPDDYGDNPVFIDGVKCWRRYKFGGWVTMRDMHDCMTLEAFYEKNRSHYENKLISP